MKSKYGMVYVKLQIKTLMYIFPQEGTICPRIFWHCYTAHCETSYSALSTNHAYCHCEWSTTNKFHCTATARECFHWSTNANSSGRKVFSIPPTESSTSTIPSTIDATTGSAFFSTARTYNATAAYFLITTTTTTTSNDNAARPTHDASNTTT